ncbi:hypothetical protein NC651_038356 [Populus alba x Populus x berolinensis]|nr:hypothetical protein NC651_038356 [Populus alba x Populus x berolinensis]
MPGDIIEGFAENNADELFVPAKARSDLSSQLGKISQQTETVWLKVRRGERTLKLRAREMPDKSAVLQRRFTIKAANDDRHVAVLGDLTLEQCTELQGRCMAWFSAAVSSGVPIVFINIQTEQTLNVESIFLLKKITHKFLFVDIPFHYAQASGLRQNLLIENLLSNFLCLQWKEKTLCTGKELSWGGQKSNNTPVQILQGIRLWFLPGVAEILLEMIPEPGETRFGMDIKRIDEVLLVISRLEGKSLMPSSVCSMGLIHCCDQNEVKDTLISSIDEMDSMQIHPMVWPNQTHSSNTQANVVANLQPPKGL